MSGLKGQILTEFCGIQLNMNEELYLFEVLHDRGKEPDARVVLSTTYANCLQFSIPESENI
jgi:hypothetical protein